jgi:hypothetical protein
MASDSEAPSYDGIHAQISRRTPPLPLVNGNDSKGSAASTTTVGKPFTALGKVLDRPDRTPADEQVEE